MIVNKESVQKAKQTDDFKLYYAVFSMDKTKFFQPKDVQEHMEELGIPKRSLYTIRKKCRIWAERGQLKQVGEYFIVL